MTAPHSRLLTALARDAAPDPAASGSPRRLAGRACFRPDARPYGGGRTGEVVAVEQRFRFAFDPRFRLPLAALGIWPSNCEVVVTDEHFDARYGPWRLQTPRSNLRTAQVAGPFSILKAIGPRGSLADRGATFGTTAAGGACLTFHEPVGALLGRRYFAHPGLTVTVEDPAALVEALDLPPGP